MEVHLFVSLLMHMNSNKTNSYAFKHQFMFKNTSYIIVCKIPLQLFNQMVVLTNEMWCQRTVFKSNAKRKNTKEKQSKHGHLRKWKVKLGAMEECESFADRFHPPCALFRNPENGTIHRQFRWLIMA